jgi:DNA-binding response OmpR family regulator
LKVKVLALGSDEVTSWVSTALVAKGIEVVRLYELPETISLLKQEGFNLVVVDSGIEDVENICFRIVWLCRIRVAVILRDPLADTSNLRFLGVDAFYSTDGFPDEFAGSIQALAGQGLHKFKSIKAAIVEDDRHIREAIRLCFKIFWPEAEVDFADSAESGMVLLKKRPLDIVLLDLGLPDKPGFEVLSWFRNTSKIPVIILTAARDKENITRAINDGANDYLVKPFKQIELMPRVQKYVLLKDSLTDN